MCKLECCSKPYGRGALALCGYRLLSRGGLRRYGGACAGVASAFQAGRNTFRIYAGPDERSKGTLESNSNATGNRDSPKLIQTELKKEELVFRSDF